MKILYFLPLITLYVFGWINWSKEYKKRYLDRSAFADMWLFINVFAGIVLSLSLAIIGLSKILN